MKAKGTHEGCIEQIQRLFEKQMYNGNGPRLRRAKGRVRHRRLGDGARRAEGGLRRLAAGDDRRTFDGHADFAGYQSDFLKNFGFGVAGIDYEAPTEVERPIEDA
jgi:enoyl-[acyl-carrier protein] reductase/trans-2-enoyl-CoA reductase (NAD+)